MNSVTPSSTARPEEATIGQYFPVEKKSLSPLQYLAKTVTVAAGGETLARAMRCDYSATHLFSATSQKIEDLTGFGKWFKSFGAEAAGVSEETVNITAEVNATMSKETFEKVAEQISETVIEASKETIEQAAASPATNVTSWSEYAYEWVHSGYQESVDLGSRTWNCVSEYATDNAHWFIPTVGMAASFAMFNYLSYRKIRNPYARNVASVAFAIFSVWGTSQALGHFGYIDPQPLMKTIDIGARIMAYSGIANIATYAAQKGMPLLYRAINPLNAPLAYEGSYKRKKPKA